MAAPAPRPRKPSAKPAQARPQKREKLPRLPPNAKVSKRPILRPAIPSPHKGPDTPKCVYISNHTPFLSAVKRVEKLLGYAEKRAMQSAMTLSKQDSRNRRPAQKRKRGTAEQEEDGIMDAALLAEQEKAKRRKNVHAKSEDVVVVKGTGKAVQKVLEIGLWFQQREEYDVKLSTGSVGTIDDISVDEGKADEDADEQRQDLLGEVPEPNGMEGIEQTESVEETAPPDKSHAEGRVKVDHPSDESSAQPARGQKGKRDREVSEEVPETRIRYVSVLNVTVSLR